MQAESVLKNCGWLMKVRKCISRKGEAARRCPGEEQSATVREPLKGNTQIDSQMNECTEYIFALAALMYKM